MNLTRIEKIILIFIRMWRRGCAGGGVEDDVAMRKTFEQWYLAAAQSGEIDSYMATYACPMAVMPFFIGFRAALQTRSRSPQVEELNAIDRLKCEVGPF